MKRVEQYQGVQVEKRSDIPDKYSAIFVYGGKKHFKVYNTPLDAAIGYDMMRMEKGLNPVNELSGDEKARKLKKINLLYINGCSLFTDTRKEITKFIKDGRTALFDDELEAIKQANKSYTYHYSVYNEYNKSVGFAVPK